MWIILISVGIAKDYVTILGGMLLEGEKYILIAEAFYADYDFFKSTYNLTVNEPPSGGWCKTEPINGKYQFDR